MNINYKYNPFSGIHDADVEEILVSRFDATALVGKITSSNSLAIEFLGKQGRGKTTHLKYLHQRMEEYPIFLLDSSSSITDIDAKGAKVIFVDSIHHLNLIERVRLFKTHQNIVYTTHYGRKFECLLAGKDRHCIKFKGISTDVLLDIISKRLESASVDNGFKKESFSRDDAEKLIATFGDNYRGIMNQLYENYQ